MALVFMFVARTRLPVKHSIVNVLRKRYGKILVKNVRKFEKYEFKYKKAILDLDFLLTCKEKNIIPKFLRFKVANRQLQFQNAHNICLIKIIESRDIKQTQAGQNYKTEFNIHKGRFTSRNVLLILYTSLLFFLVSNDKAISKIQKTHSKKLHNLFLSNYYHDSVTSHNADKVILNFSSHVLTDHEKSLLS